MHYVRFRRYCYCQRLEGGAACWESGLFRTCQYLIGIDLFFSNVQSLSLHYYYNDLYHSNIFSASVSNYIPVAHNKLLFFFLQKVTMTTRNFHIMYKPLKTTSLLCRKLWRWAQKDIMTRLNFYASSTKEKEMVYATLFTFWKEWSLSLGTIVLGFLLWLLLLFNLQRFKKIRALHRAWWSRLKSSANDRYGGTWNTYPVDSVK